MIDSTSRKYVQSGFDRFAKVTRIHKIHPNKITVLGFVIGVLASIAVGYGALVVGLVLLWISGGLDVLDGTVARLTSKSSTLGAYLDLVFDRVVEGVLIFGFYIFMPENAIAYFIFFIGAMFNFSTFMLAGNLFKNKGKKSMHYDSGLVERTETFIVFSLMMIFPQWSFGALMVFNVLMILTGIRRMGRIIIHEMRKENK